MKRQDPIRFGKPNRFGVPDTEYYVHQQIARLRDAIPKLREAGKTEMLKICEADLAKWKQQLDFIKIEQEDIRFQITGEQLTLFGGQTE